MVKPSKESLEAFQATLETIDNSWQSEFNLRETVRQSFGLIKRAKEYKVSWEKIAEILKQSSGITDAISPESIRQYYFEFAKNPDLLPKKKRKTSSTKSQAQGSTLVQTSSKIKEISSATPDMNQQPASTVQAKSQQDSLPAFAPQPESTPEGFSSEDQVVNQSIQPEVMRQSKEDVRSQFNLGRRRK